MSRSRVLSYLVAVLSVAITVTLSFLFSDLVKLAPLLIFMPAVAFSALYGGLGPALLATALSTLAVTYSLVPSLNLAALDWSILQRLGLFTAVALLISWFQEVRRKAENAANEQAYRSAATLASITDAVITTDVHAHITAMNRVAETLTGWKEREVQGFDIERMLILVSEDARQPISAPLDRALRQGTTGKLPGPTLLIQRNGMETPVDDYSAPIKNRNGKIIGAVLVIRDISERRKTERALQESEARFRTVADKVPIMIWMADTDLQFTFFNQYWLDFTGRTLEQERGIGWIEGVHPLDRQPCLDAFQNVVGLHHPLRVEFRLLRRDGDYRWVQVTGTPNFEASGGFAGFIGCCLDITERKYNDEAQGFLIRATTVLASSLDYDVTFQSVARLAVPELADWCAIEIVEKDGSLRQAAVAHIDAEKVSLAREWRQRYPPDPNTPAMQEVLRHGKSQLIPIVTDEMLVAGARDADHLQIARTLGLTSVVIVPILVRGQAAGTITLVSTKTERHYDATNVSLAEELARRAALAMENARLYSEAQQARQTTERGMERMARSQDVTAGLSAAISTSEVAEVVMSRGMPAINAAAGTLYLLTGDGKTLELVKSFGIAEEFLTEWEQFSVDAPVPSADAVRTGRTIWLESRQVAEMLYPAISNSNQNHRAWAVVPLILDENVLGTMSFSFAKEQAFHDDDKAYMNLLAQKCAQALDRTRLFEAEKAARAVAEQEKARLAFMIEASTVLTSSLDYESRLVNLANLVVPSLADACTVDVVDGNGPIRRMAIAARDSAKMDVLCQLRDKYPPTRERSHVLSEVLRTGEPWLYQEINDATRRAAAYDDEHLRLLTALGAVSALTLPLVVGGRILGAFTLLSTEPTHHYTAEDLAQAQELGRRAGLAVDNARLYRESREQRERLRVTLGSIGDAVIATNTEGRITFMNAIAEQLTGWTEEEAIGVTLEKVFAIVSESGRHVVENPVERVIREGAVVGLANHTLLIRKDSTDIPIDDSAAPIRDDDGTLFGVVLVFRDVGERRLAEARLQSTLERTLDLYEVCREIGLVYTPSEVLQALLKSRYTRQAAQVAIILFDKPWRMERPQSYEVMATWKLDKPLPGFGSFGSLENSPLANLVVRDRPLLIEDAQTDNRLDEALRGTCAQMEISSIKVFPLAAGGEFFGLLVIYYAAPYRATADDLRHIRIFADQISVAMDNVRLFAAEARARRDAEQANQVKLKFLAMISHELRTPLTSIKGFATTLLATDVKWDAESQRDFVSTISEEADKLSELIEQLLDLSRLQAGTLRIQPQSKHVRDILNMSLAQLESVTMHHRLDMFIADDLPPVIADPHRVGQVLVNLVENAAKYAPQGTKIAISAEEKGAMVQICIIDQGPGIPVEDRQRIFEPFRQAETTIAKQSKGAGLGLAICRGLIEAQGGKIWVADSAEPGASLCFTLPIAGAHHR